MNTNHTGRIILVILLSLVLLAGSFSGGVIVGMAYSLRVRDGNALADRIAGTGNRGSPNINNHISQSNRT